jgi:hypothetical protein
MRVRDAVKRFLAAEDWAYKETEAGLRLNFGASGGQWRCFARIREPEGQLIFYSYAPLEIGAAERRSITETITRANFGLWIGNFELDLDTGVLQFRTSIDVEGEEEKLSPVLLRHLVYQNVLTMNRYLPAFRAVLERQATPRAAVEAAEAGGRSPR